MRGAYDLFMVAHTASDTGSLDERARLTPREIEVLMLAARGMTNAKAAATLGVSVHAVKFHLASIYRKLGVANRTEAAALFIRSEGAGVLDYTPQRPPA